MKTDLLSAPLIVTNFQLIYLLFFFGLNVEHNKFNSNISVWE